ncbi:shikimate kinase [Candidatus Roizmanbacteria bacterium]|nr:shikimate kinase [Candidatus Roizmanbacteria bacterium]
MKIVLIGFMGSGKTSVSHVLAKKLSIQCIEIDEFILKASGRTSTNEIFDIDGEEKFRELEIETAKKLRNIQNVIISTGGGIVMNKINLNYLNHGGNIVFLNASFEIIRKRLSGDNSRPLFRDLKKAKKLFNFRLPLYKEYSNMKIGTDNLTIDQVVAKLVNKLKQI